MPKPYLPSREIEFDEAEWDRWLTLSESQMDAEVETEKRKYSEFLNAMTSLQSYRYWRRFLLISCMENRRRLRNPNLSRIEIVDQMFRDGIKRSQRSLLKHRHYLKTGVWPGEA